ncbi:ABC-2 family transporter protein [Nodosilinea sp. LEGE 07298]|uniref:ABC transporter permease n=1 Tax=Nodosilinea sp. LEGE 07298 TaxID=2777970 RepID=UPI001880C372|nr:ABC transporter permease [Nodosilinea sp. LEGE 07298]MBE9113070.1 ABC-2 family transporter protein [Nodosilinea sp. LEGE 07298]
MKRYWKVLRLFWSTAIAAELEYRLNFLVTALISLGGLAGSLFGLFLFYRTGYEFEGWSWEAALLVLGLFTVLQGFSAMVLIPNLNKIVNQVQQGTLDFVLIKPISSQFWLSTRIISPWGLPDVVFGLVMIGYGGSRLGLGWADYGLAIVPLALGAITLYSLWFMLGATSIWFVKIYNVTEVLRGLLEAGRFPIAAYPVAYRVFFTFVVPVAFLTTVPAQTMLGQGGRGWLLASALLAVVLLLVANRFWRFALRFYTSASS